MQCPACRNVRLEMTDRRGVEIDYCPECRGVWLDRGELDKIIERSAGGPERGLQRGGSQQHEEGKRKKKGSLLGELFDF